MNNWKKIILIHYFRVQKDFRKASHLSLARVGETFQDLRFASLSSITINSIDI